MPQATDELRDYWGGVDDAPALEHLKSRGFVLGNDWCFRHPDPGFELSERDCNAIDFMVQEWDYGGFEKGAADD